jgi:hypothetical protein
VAEKIISFEALPMELQKLSQNIEKSFDESIKDYTVSTVSRLYDNSPVLTGLFRSNHNVSIGQRYTGDFGITDKETVLTGLFRSNHNVSIGQRYTGDFGITDKETVISDAKSKINEFNSKKDKTVFIQNNLDYAEALENGHSKQAPAGVYGQTISGGNFKFIKKGLS